MSRASDVGKPADVVLEGGGVKGIGLAGAILKLDEAGYTFQRIAGTSAGAIAAAIVAALVRAGEPVAKLADVLKTIEYGKFMAESRLRSMLGPAADAEHLLLHMGLYDGDYLVEWLDGVLEGIGITTFGDLALDDPAADTRWTPSQRFSLVVHTSDLTRGKLVRLPWDYPEYGLEPADQKISAAVRASMSIPFFFEPVKFNAPETAHYKAGHVTWVDGGLLDNYPVDVFDRTDGAPSRWPTVGIKLSAEKTVQQHPADVHGVIGEAIACLRTALSNADRTYVDDAKAKRTIFVDTMGIAATDFHLTEEQQTGLYNNGRSAAEKWIGALPPAQPAAAPTAAAQ
ncbi:MAG TPA: patatin-like phospholipase family protein [Jatrophihabitans sp.]|nr:patatin-like phospholipase family protein [Jatrophihabitans sp.]